MHVDGDFALRGKLDGIADHVGQHLTQTPRIPNHSHGHARIDTADVFHALLLRFQRKQIAHALHHHA